LAYSAVGSPETVRRRLEAVTAETKADEIIVTGQIHDHRARLQSFEIVAEVREALAASQVDRASGKEAAAA
jgi:alkanesulfonate monooxygenase SsuD/methylene tetrahydromethanopterin reductase-like flavin-dependent oxidoreductase (luciferase family)